MKRAVCILCAVVMLFSLAACGSKTQPSTTPEPSTSETTTPAETPTPSNETDWPKSTITVICAYSAGGSSDLQCRIMADALSKELGVPVIVENKTGNGGYTGFEELLNSKPDGYTMGLLNTPGIAVCDISPEDPKDYNAFSFTLLANHVSDYNVLAWSKGETRWHDMASFVEYAKDHELLYGCSVMLPTGDDITVANYLNNNYGTKLTAIPSSGSKDSETFLMNGSADFLIGNCADVVTGLANGTLEVGMVCAPERVDLMPDVPTCAEAGFGDLVMFSARLYAFPPNVDQAITDKMIAALDKVINSKDVIKQLEDMGANTAYYGGEDCVNYLQSVRKLMVETNGLVEK